MAALNLMKDRIALAHPSYTLSDTGSRLSDYTKYDTQWAQVIRRFTYQLENGKSTRVPAITAEIRVNPEVQLLDQVTWGDDTFVVTGIEDLEDEEFMVLELRYETSKF